MAKKNKEVKKPELDDDGNEIAAPEAVSPADFVLAWESSKDAAECAEKTGMTKKACTTRAQYMRGKKINLKKMPRGAPNQPKLDVEGLNELIASLK